VAAAPRRGVTADLSEVAADIGATVDDARRRDQRLLDAGVIAEWVARLDPAAVCAGLTAFLLLRVAHNAENYTVVRQSPGSTRVEPGEVACVPGYAGRTGRAGGRRRAELHQPATIRSAGLRAGRPKGRPAGLGWPGRLELRTGSRWRGCQWCRTGAVPAPGHVFSDAKASARPSQLGLGLARYQATQFFPMLMLGGLNLHIASVRALRAGPRRPQPTGRICAAGGPPRWLPRRRVHRPATRTGSRTGGGIHRSPAGPVRPPHGMRLRAHRRGHAHPPPRRGAGFSCAARYSPRATFHGAGHLWIRS